MLYKQSKVLHWQDAGPLVLFSEEYTWLERSLTDPKRSDSEDLQVPGCAYRFPPYSGPPAKEATQYHASHAESTTKNEKQSWRFRRQKWSGKAETTSWYSAVSKPDFGTPQSTARKLQNKTLVSSVQKRHLFEESPLQRKSPVGQTRARRTTPIWPCQV